MVRWMAWSQQPRVLTGATASRCRSATTARTSAMCSRTGADVEGVLAVTIADAGCRIAPTSPTSSLERQDHLLLREATETRSDSLCWDDLKALRDIWPGKLLVKGILHPEDAVKSIELGAAGVIVWSNHGVLNNCDAVPSPIEVLPDVVAVVGDRTTQPSLRQRHPSRQRCREGAGARREDGADRPSTLPAPRLRARRVRSARWSSTAWISRSMAEIACNKVSEIGPEHVAFQIEWFEPKRAGAPVSASAPSGESSAGHVSPSGRPRAIASKARRGRAGEGAAPA